MGRPFFIQLFDFFFQSIEKKNVDLSKICRNNNSRKMKKIFEIEILSSLTIICINISREPFIFKRKTND